MLADSGCEKNWAGLGCVATDDARLRAPARLLAAARLIAATLESCLTTDCPRGVPSAVCACCFCSTSCQLFKTGVHRVRNKDWQSYARVAAPAPGKGTGSGGGGHWGSPAIAALGASALAYLAGGML